MDEHAHGLAPLVVPSAPEYGGVSLRGRRTDTAMDRSMSAETPGRASRTRSGIVRPQAPHTIPLSPIKAGTPLQQASPQVPTPGRLSSPLLTWANELPDDPGRASNVVNLFAHNALAPAWSPASMSPSARSPPLTPPQLVAVAPALPARTRSMRSPEPNIFERDIERQNSHCMSPQEAIDVAVPPVLDDAANAIVDQNTSAIEVVAPSPGHVSPGLSPSWCTHRESQRRAQQDPLYSPPHGSLGLTLADAHASQQQFGRTHSHRRPLSDASNVFASIPRSRRTGSDVADGAASPGSLRYAPGSVPPGSAPPSSQPPAGLTPTGHPPTPSGRSLLATDPRAGATGSPSLSIDGAIIPEGNTAKVGHSLDGLADALANTRLDPGTTVASPGSVSGTSGGYFGISAPSDDGGGTGTPVPHSNTFRYQVLGGGGHSLNARARSTSQSQHGWGPASLSTLGRPTSRSADVSAPGDASSTPCKKRISFLAYANILNDNDELLLRVDEHAPAADGM
ncbi:hypothetical protein MSPP1_002964 [Malassezia sp. CBS 17886]|nr:hypothetical protein MSPP1_002964 [Malassezia sp. CBS 17886]